MDLSQYSIEDIVVSAIRSEADARDVYDLLAEQVSNAILKDRLHFLASEERKHQTYVEGLFMSLFPGTDLVLPDSSPVPLPMVRMPGEDVQISEVLSDAMSAEVTAADFYTEFSGRFDKGSQEREMLGYFADMERMHYDILKIEKEHSERFEDFDVEWGMMHVGP
jgi:rubrerythrin